MNEPLEAEPLETTAIAVREPNQAVAPPVPSGMFRGDPAEVVEQATKAANVLKDVIRSQGLISKISNKEYPRCEAWTLLGSMLGIFPVLQWSKQVPGGWEARVEAKTLSGAVVGAAEALCLRSERNWKDRDDFALRSMAQTRATAKALRMPLGFVMTLAGFEPTPAEEMVADHPQKAPPKAAPSPTPAQKPPAPVKLPTDATRAWAINELKAAPGEANHDTVVEYFRALSQLMPNEDVTDLPLRFVPATHAELRALVTCIGDFSNGDRALAAFKPHGEADTEPEKPVEVPREKKEAQDEPEAWVSFPMPWGKHAGIKLHDLDTKYLFGLVKNYVVETEYNGKPKNPATIEKDRVFRAMLDDAARHYGWDKEEKPD